MRILCSTPHYTALRDGNQTTIPESYLSRNYQAPEFWVHTSTGNNRQRMETAESDFNARDLDQLTRPPAEDGP